MVRVFLFLLHLAGFRDHRLEVVRIAVIPRLDGVVTAVADEAKPLCHRRSLGEGLVTFVFTCSIYLVIK